MVKPAIVLTVYAALAISSLAAALEKAPGPDAAKSECALDDIRQHAEGLAIWWTGHNGWLIKSDGLLLAQGGRCKIGYGLTRHTNGAHKLIARFSNLT